MYILDHKKGMIFDSEYIILYFLDDKGDAVLVSVVTSDRQTPRTLGRYPTQKEAETALYALYSALASGERYFDMPPGTIQEPVKKDARTARRGGS